MNVTQDDGIHPTTIFQGLIANAVLRALNEHYGTRIKLLAGEEIVRVAFGKGVNRGGDDNDDHDD